MSGAGILLNIASVLLVFMAIICVILTLRVYRGVKELEGMLSELLSEYRKYKKGEPNILGNLLIERDGR